MIVLILRNICSSGPQENVAESPCCNKLFMITTVEEGLLPHIYADMGKMEEKG